MVTEKKIIETRLISLKKSYKWSSVWFWFWVILGTITFIIGGWLMYLFAFLCSRKARNTKKEIFELELKLSKNE